jgi:hypothetical protein
MRAINQKAHEGESMNTEDLPVAIIGAGPVGLAAAAHLVARNVPVRLYEAGETAGANVLQWGHVRLFSPWSFNTDPTAVDLLRDCGWQTPPPGHLPTGRELYDSYLAPLADLLADHGAIETETRVRAVSRRGIDKVVTKDRADRPFALSLERSGKQRIDYARAVIDASGTWTTPNPLGAAGVALPGETEFADRIAYGVPDVLGSDRAVYAGKRVLVVGGGHSAANVLLDLARLAETDNRLRLIWAVRAKSLARVFGGGEADRLPGRGKLGADLKHLVASGRLQLATGFSADQLIERDGGLVVSGLPNGSTPSLGPVDRIVVCTGQRPDLALTRELRLDLDPWLECPRTVGPMIDPNLHSCGSVPPHGYKELAHPEPGYFTVGIKSYGRAPTFLMATGYEQVRSIAAHLAGDHAAAKEVRLVLPETGVCTTSFSAAADAQCCGGPSASDPGACCEADAQAKVAGASGCGCGPKAAVARPL